MNVWWEALSAFQRVFVCIAIPSTLLMVVQFILTLIGIGDGADADADGNFDSPGEGIDLDGDGVIDVEAPSGEGDDPFNFGLVFRLFTLRGMIAFLAVMGWVGYGLDETSLPRWGTILISVACGLVMMLLIAAIFSLFRKLQSSGNLNLKNALGQSGSVYLKIPANRSGIGKVNLVVQGKFGEFEAVTDEDEDIPYGTEIVVIALSGVDTLVIKRK